MMELANKTVTVVGLGVTGIAVARFLKKRGAKVCVSDQAVEQTLGPLPQGLREMGIAVELGHQKSQSFHKADLVVLSPGVPHTIEPIERAKQQGIPVIGEVELASRFIDEPILAITGTNGKTTTTEILGKMLKDSGLKVFVGGNIGNPLIDYLEENQKADFIVAELSSFQLDTIDTFRPRVGVLLNITADHLDRYSSFDAYAASKIRIFANQRPEDIAVLNGSDPMVRLLTKPLKKTKIYYASLKKGEDGAVNNGTRIWFRFNESQKRDPKGYLANLISHDHSFLDVTKVKLIGRHNLENAAAAALAALAAGASPKTVQESLNRYQGPAHRLEHIDMIHGVDFINDSKATNVDAVIRAVESFSEPVVLIMGGQDKGGDFSRLKEVLAGHVKRLIVMGSAASLIQSQLGDTVPTISVLAMADAVKQAYRVVSPGNVILLSPGCASFDAYDNYAQRGEDFKKAVKNFKLQLS
ncbi:MAG: UDP-N-acetylmuramoyl-L-alanine--D-glutamate ligase [Desulfobacterales bacterium]|jgi:UDP-N-acetylmuramoylalanine--D-glutamate ligase